MSDTCAIRQRRRRKEKSNLVIPEDVSKALQPPLSKKAGGRSAKKGTGIQEGGRRQSQMKGSLHDN